MNRLSTEKRRAVIASLVEGNSIRATARMTGVSKDTVVKLLVDLGSVCSVHMDRTLRNLSCERIQADEIWAFVGSKQKNTSPEKRALGHGDVWTWVAICADTKLVVSYRLSAERDLGAASEFMADVVKRLAHRVQLTTDAHRSYLNAVEGAFDGDVDYAQLQKLYGPDKEGERRYSPAVCTGVSGRIVSGDPDPDYISTSYIERQNLTMRMSMRRYTRLTNGYSKKVENLAAAVSLHYAFYNFVRVHQTLGTSPAVAAGITDHVWKLDELIGLLQATESTPTKRGPYKPRKPKVISN